MRIEADAFLEVSEQRDQLGVVGACAFGGQGRANSATWSTSGLLAATVRAEIKSTRANATRLRMPWSAS